MIRDKYRFLIACKSFGFSAEAYLNSVYSSHRMWLMTHRLPIASNFGREIPSNPVRHVISHAPASWGMCLCIKQGWSGVWDEIEGLWFSWRPRARSRAWRIRHSINVRKIGKDNSRESSFDRYRLFGQIVYLKND